MWKIGYYDPLLDQTITETHPSFVAALESYKMLPQRVRNLKLRKVSK